MRLVSARSIEICYNIVLTVPVRVGHNNIPRAELGEELLHELERRVVLDSKWRLVHIAGEVIRILAEDD